MCIAPLDRRITTNSKADQFADTKRLSDLANEPYVVLLGEPGLGKTEAFKHFADAGGFRYGEACSWDSGDLDPNGTYFIDAIDEISIDKARDVALALKRAAGCRWRVSCRAEDWNSGGALSKAFGSGNAAVGTEPVVAQLQPLDEVEAIAVLTALGHQTPSIMMSTLQTLNSTPFVMTPLGLRFLMTVRPEQMPEITRYQLYDLGIRHLAKEHNEVKAESEATPSRSTILDTAGRIFLTLLMAGKHGVQRSDLGSNNVLDLSEIDIDSVLANAVLDTALFTKKGEEFVPLHRSIQEFLAAKFLARLVSDGLGGTKLHIERALALIVSLDGLPTEGFKPLYAWFACHLVDEGAIAESKRLVERDPETLLLHGDAAKLPWDFRAHILRAMGQRDPYFKWSPDRWGPVSSCTTGLITFELHQQVLSILGSETSHHRLLTVLEALSTGRPMIEAADACWKVVLQESANFWSTEVGVGAWFNCANPSDQVIWQKINELAIEHGELGHHRSRLIVRLFCLIPADRLAVQDVLSIVEHLCSVAGVVKSGPVAGVLGLSRTPGVPISTFYAIRELAGHIATPHLWRELILANPKQWRISCGVGSIKQRFASELCTAVLTHSTDVTTDEFAKMMLATGSIITTSSTQVYTSAAAKWVAVRTDQNEIAKALLLAGDEDVADAGPIAAGLREFGLQPNTEIITWMLTHEPLLNKLGPVYVGRQVTYWTLQQSEGAPSWLMDLLKELDDSEAVLSARQSVAEHTEELLQARARQLNQVEDHLLKQIPEWAAAATSIESGKYTDALFWAGEIYCGNSPLTLVSHGGRDALQEAFGEPLGQSMLTGLTSVLLAKQEHKWRILTKAASAAVVLEQQPDGLRSLAVEQVLEIFFATDQMRYAQGKELVENYCVERLSQALMNVPTSLDLFAVAGDARLSSLVHKLANRPTESLLHQWAARKALAHPEDLYGWLLHSVLVIARLNLDEDELVPVISAALSEPMPEQSNSVLESVNTTAANRLWWAFFGASLIPDLFADYLAQCLEEVDPATMRDQLVGNFEQLISGFNPAAILAISSLLMRSIIQCDPEQGFYDGPHWPEVMKVLRSISSLDGPQAEVMLQALVELSKGTRWVDTMQHQLELHRRDLRAQSKKPIAPKALMNVLSGRGPVDAQDLRALVICVLEDIAAEMQSSAFNPWKFYWRTSGSTSMPKVENDCRDVIAEKLADKLGQFGRFMVQPEVASSGGTRADIQITFGDFAVPIEAKRTNHEHLWYGHTGQLQTYALTRNAESQGIFLVFWFGKGLTVTTPPKGVTPTTPQGLKGALEQILNPALLGTTSVVVLDVSDAATAAKVRKVSEFERDKADKPKREPKPKSTPKPKQKRTPKSQGKGSIGSETPPNTAES